MFFNLQMDPGKRPAFSEIVDCLEIIKEHRLVLPHTNPIAAKSHIAVGHVRRHINKFSKKMRKKRIEKQEWWTEQRKDEQKYE